MHLATKRNRKYLALAIVVAVLAIAAGAVVIHGVGDDGNAMADSSERQPGAGAGGGTGNRTGSPASGEKSKADAAEQFIAFEDNRPKKCPERIGLYQDGELIWEKTARELYASAESEPLKARRGVALQRLFEMAPDVRSIAVHSCWSQERSVYGPEKFVDGQPVFYLVPNKKGAVKLERFRGESSATVYRGIRRIELSKEESHVVMARWRTSSGRTETSDTE